MPEPMTDDILFNYLTPGDFSSQQNTADPAQAVVFTSDLFDDAAWPSFELGAEGHFRLGSI